MIPSMDGMLNDLRRLTDQRLLATLHDAVRRERHITLRVLLLLIAVEQRRLHIDRYSSLFAYCTDRLEYSSSAAGRRIAGARCLRDYPRAWPMLFDGRLNLTTLCIIARVITPENAEELLDRAAGGTQRQVEELAAQYGGPKPVRDRIKPVRSLRRSPRSASPRAREANDSHTSGWATSQAGSEAGNGSGAGATGSQTSGDFGPGGRSPKPEGVGADQSSGCGSGSRAESAASSRAQFGSGEGAPQEATASSASGATGTGSTSGAGASSETAAGSGGGAPNCDNSADSSAGTSSRQSQHSADSSTGSSGAQASNESLTYEITFRADAAFVEKLRRLQALLSTNPNPPLAPIFDRAIQLALDRHDPERRQARRDSRRARKAEQASESAATRDPAFTPTNDAAPSSEKSGQRIGDEKDAGKNSAPSPATKPRRAGMTARPKLPQWLRDQVAVRDGHRCTYVGPDGRCPAVTDLEIDHICPHAQGGNNHIDNLRTLCRAHNQRAAEVVFGIAFMRRCRGVDTSSPDTNLTGERAIGAAELEEMSQMESVPV